MDIDLDKQNEELKLAQKLADNGFIDTAISVVDEVFKNFCHFRAWYIAQESLFPKNFMDWVAKIEVFMWGMPGVQISEDDAKLVMQTYLDIYCLPSYNQYENLN